MLHRGAGDSPWMPIPISISSSGRSKDGLPLAGRCSSNDAMPIRPLAVDAGGEELGDLGERPLGGSTCDLQDGHAHRRPAVLEGSPRRRRRRSSTAGLDASPTTSSAAISKFMTSPV